MTTKRSTFSWVRPKGKTGHTGAEHHFWSVVTPYDDAVRVRRQLQRVVLRDDHPPVKVKTQLLVSKITYVTSDEADPEGVGT